MKIKDYLIERWYYFIIAILVLILFILLGWSSYHISSSDFIYLLSIYVLANIVYTLIDFYVLKSRIRNMKSYIDNSATNDIKSMYPLDIAYAKEIKESLKSFNDFKQQIEYEHNRELEFITKWVHDVKVPISAIDLLIDNLSGDMVKHVQMNLSNIDQNIQKILFHIKSKSFHDDYIITRVSLKKIVNTSLRPFSIFFSHKSISLNIDIADTIIDTDEKWSIYIVSQLISNAVKYTYINGKIDIYTIDNIDSISIHVRNTGRGIEKTELENIFTRGYCGYTERKEKSTGYGLFLAKKLSDTMGLKLYAKSIKDEYAEFIVTFIKSNETPHLTKL